MLIPKVSIVVPVYNAECYIEACIASLMAQTIDEVEIILVDDHGADRSMELAKAYVAHHKSRKQFHFLETSHNMGPGPARNVGIEAAQGEYIGFVDSDDVVAPDFCESLYATAKGHDADLAYCQAQIVKGDVTLPMTNPVIENGVFEGEKRRFFLTHYTTLFVSFLYRRTLLKEYGIRFPGTRSAEDSYFLTCSLLAARHIACVDKPMYHYIVREESLSESRNPLRYRDKVKSFDLLMQFAHEKGFYGSDREELDFIYFKKGYLLGILTYICNEEHPQQLTVCKLHEHLLSYVPDYKDNAYYRVDCKLRLLHVLVRKYTRLAFRILPYYIRKTKMKL